MNSNDPMNQFTAPSIPIEKDTNMQEVASPPREIRANVTLGPIPPSPTVTSPEPMVKTNIQNNMEIKEEESKMNIQDELPKIEPFMQEKKEIKPEGKFFDILPGREAAIEKQAEEMNTNVLNNDALFSAPLPPVNEIEKKEDSLDNLFKINKEVTPREEIDIPTPPKEENTISLSSILDKNNLISRKEIEPKEEKPIVDPFKELSNLAAEPIIPTPSANPVQEKIVEPSAKPSTSASAPLSYSMREAINIARDASDKIEALGVQIDTEEMDLPDCYEIRIKLIKED